MLKVLKTWVVMVLMVALAAGQGSPSAEKRTSKTSRTQVSQLGASAPADAPTPDNGKASGSDFEKNVAQSVVENTSDPDDHVPCFFSLKQLNDLQPIPSVSKLTEADQSRVLKSVVTTVDQANDKELTRTQKASFIALLADDLDGRLVGKTPGEALATIMDILYKITAKDPAILAGLAASTPDPIRQTVIEKARTYAGDDFAKAVQKTLASPEPSWFQPNDPITTSNRLATLIAEIPDEMAGPTDSTAHKALKGAADKTAGDLKITGKNAGISETLADPTLIREKTIGSARTYGGDIFGNKVQEKLANPNPSWFESKNPSATANSLATLIEAVPDELAATTGSAPTKATKDAASDIAGILTRSNQPNQLNSSLVDTARTEINKFVRPGDVGCAYQILSWNQARLFFGRSVANDFIAVQVTIRNINKNEEFIVHNAMLSMRTDIHGAIGQYFEGADKIGVESYNSAGESLTRRGIVGNSIVAASALLSTLQPIVNVSNFSNAVATFSGGVVPGWKTMSPDHQKEQLLTIANYGFSATNNFKTVVPKSGVATFYTWYPVKPFLEGWWIQDCAQEIAAVKPIEPPDPTKPTPTDPRKTDPGGSEHPPEVGVDLYRARNLCAGVPVSTWKTMPYQKWSSISDQLFRDLSLAVVAGIHVREDSKNKSSITDLKCPKDTQGRLDLSKASSNGTFSCDVSGENLDKVTKLRLENAGNLVDPARPEGVVSEVSSDNTTAKVAFNTSDLNAAPGDSYNVFVVGKDGTETATGQKVYLKHDAPKLTSVTPSSLDLGKKPLDKLTLAGTNLDTLKNVCLKGSGSETKTIKVSDAKSTQATVDVSSAGLTKGDWTIYAENCTDSNNGEKPPTLTVTPAKSKTRVGSLQ